jgi:hypothetical protein
MKTVVVAELEMKNSEVLSDIKWYEHKEVGVRGSWCLEPYGNIFIGSYPMDGATKEWADQFDAVVNVSCNHSTLFEPSRPDQRTYWYPVNECGEWSYAYFALMFKILDYHHGKKHKIFVHCAAGAYRSPSIVFRWLEYLGKHKLLDAYEISHGQRVDRSDEREGMMHYRLFSNYIFGNMPQDYLEFAKRLKHDNDHTGYTFVTSLPNNSNPQVHAFRLQDANIFETWFRKLKYKFSNIQKKYRLYIANEKEIKLGGGWYTTIKNHHKIGANRKADLKEFM